MTAFYYFVTEIDDVMSLKLINLEEFVETVIPKFSRNLSRFELFLKLMNAC